MSAAAATETDAETETSMLDISADKMAAYQKAVSEKADEVREAREMANELAAEGKEREEVKAELAQNLNLQNAVITVVVAGATAYAGINVMSEIGKTLALSQGDMFYNSSQSLESGINSFFTNMPTVFVVIALVLIIGYLTLLR